MNEDATEIVEVHAAALDSERLRGFSIDRPMHLSTVDRRYLPIAGWVLPLAEIPDPVFAQGMAGDGVAIDPASGTLLAPCDGEVVLTREFHGGRPPFALGEP